MVTEQQHQPIALGQICSHGCRDLLVYCALWSVSSQREDEC